MLSPKIIFLFITFLSMQCGLPGDGRDWVNQRHHEAKEEGALPFHEFLLEINKKGDYR